MSFGPLDELARHPDASVLVVHVPEDADGAAHLDAARAAYPAMLVLELQGRQAHAEALRGRDVVLWPYGARVEQRLILRHLEDELSRTCSRLRVIAPKTAADELGPADLNGHKPLEWARAHAVEIKPQPMVDLDQEWFGEVPRGTPAEPIESTHERVADWRPNHPDMIEEAWPDPIDLFTRLPVPALRPEHLPPEIARFIFDQSEIIGSDPGTLALACLATAAAATHDSIRIRPRRHDRWTEEARLWCGIVGDPGIKKTPPIKRALSHIRALEIEWAAAHKAELPRYAIEQKRYAKAEAAAVNDANYPVPTPPDKPARRQLIAQDTTIEALGVALTDNPGGMMCFFDELSGFFGSMDAYRSNGGKDKSFWLEAYGGGPRNINRIGRESIPVPNLSVCILGGIQPEPMRKISAKLDDDGLLQRFILVMAQEPTLGPQDRDEDRSAVHAWRSMLDVLIEQRGRPEEPVRLSDEAHAVRDAIEAKIRTLGASEVLPMRMRSHIRKWEGLFPRVLLTYHAIACADLAVDPADVPVAGDTASRVGLFLFDYLLGHMLAFYDDVLGQSGFLSHARWIAGHILAHGATTITTRDLYRAYRPWRGMQQWETNGVMSTLELSGWCRKIDSGRHDSSRWEISPRLQEAFSARVEDEQKSRAAVLKMLSKLESK